MRKSVGKILRKCHLNSKYKGYLYIQDSVDIIVSCIENDKTTYITKDIYPVIAHSNSMFIQYGMLRLMQLITRA